MDESCLIKLRLCAPLLYADAPELEPFAHKAGEGEQLLCFEIDSEQSRRFDPERDRFLGSLLFAARAEENGGRALPAGLYFFTQRRKVLGRKDCIDLAIEQQKDGLWERLKPGNLLYIRYLFEDESPVTQLFRPYSA